MSMELEQRTFSQSALTSASGSGLHSDRWAIQRFTSLWSVISAAPAGVWAAKFRTESF